MKDKRIALKKGTRISDNDRTIQIEEEVGRGASCIVYNAAYKDPIGVEHRIRVKECYPVYLLLNRREDGALSVFEGEIEKYEKEKNNFIQAYGKNAEIRGTLGLTNSTINATDVITCNNTIYILMALDEGVDYRKYEDASLKELLGHMKSLAELIMKYHQKGYLHLDIKPENIFILPETEEHILLFDFDSVIRWEEIKQNGGFRLSFSEKFSAPEQIQGKIQKIGRHTDIYSIGAVLFYKLFDRKPDAKDCRISSEFKFDFMKYGNETYPPRLFRLLEMFFRKTLSTSTVSRWQNMQQVMDALEEMSLLADVDAAYLIDSFQYNSACFVGREEELRTIHHVLSENQLVFLSGIGGIGKTETAKQYVNRYRDQYDTVLFTVFEDSIQVLVCDEVMINKISREEKESDANYFRRKMEILKKKATPRDLIIVDNFDVDYDENLEILFQCPCKFIITTREDFRDFNYQQITIDKIRDHDEILKLFSTYNDVEYSEDESKAVNQLIEFLDHHTMTVELTAKYLRNTKSSPMELYHKFLEKEGITNIGEIIVRQRKDFILRSATVNDHLRTLFDLSGFDDLENEMISSLSLFSGIRIKRSRFEKICQIEDIGSRLEVLIKHGWIRCNEESDKIYLHQVIQDLIYVNLAPDASKCPHVVDGMIRYMSESTPNYTESRIRKQVLEIFMHRLQGETLPYTKLCLISAKQEKLQEAEKILVQKKERERFDLLQRIYRKLIRFVLEMNDIIESDLELDDFIKLQYTKVAELLDKSMECCFAYTDSPNYLVKELVDLGKETDRALAEQLWTYEDETVPELDAVYHKIMQAFDLATEKMPETNYNASEKERFYMQIQEFYSDKDFMALYRYEHFSDAEKAYWYQEKMNALRCQTSRENCTAMFPQGTETTYFLSSDVTYHDMAEQYEKKGDYEKAIAFYRRGYQEGNELFEMAMQSISQVYVKMGEYERAIKSLEQVLYADKKAEKDPEVYFSYSKYICNDLIKLLITQNQLEKARYYAEELIHYCEQDRKEEDSEYEITYLIAGYFSLYQISGNESEKELFWNQCLKYFELLGNHEIDSEIYDFVKEYIKITDVTYHEINQILDRIEKWEGKTVKECILSDTLKRFVNKEDFKQWHVLFLIKLAEVSNSFPDENAKKALEYCNLAQRYYEQYHLEDEYVRSRMYHARYESMSNDLSFGYEEKIEVQKKCNYQLLAEREICGSSCSEEKKIDIWKDAARQYGYMDDFEKEIICLKHAVEILDPILNQYDYSKFNRNYSYIMRDLIRAYIRVGHTKSAMDTIRILYVNLIHFIFETENEEEFVDKVRNMSTIGEFLEEINENETAIRIYTAAIYLEIEKSPDIRLVRKLFMTEDTLQLLCESILCQIENGVEQEAVDTIVDLNEKVLQIMEKIDHPESYQLFVKKIKEKYQYQDIEFRKR